MVRKSREQNKNMSHGEWRSKPYKPVSQERNVKIWRPKSEPGGHPASAPPSGKRSDQRQGDVTPRDGEHNRARTSANKHQAGTWSVGRVKTECPGTQMEGTDREQEFAIPKERRILRFLTQTGTDSGYAQEELEMDPSEGFLPNLAVVPDLGNGMRSERSKQQMLEEDARTPFDWAYRVQICWPSPNLLERKERMGHEKRAWDDGERFSGYYEYLFFTRRIDEDEFMAKGANLLDGNGLAMAYNSGTRAFPVNILPIGFWTEMPAAKAKEPPVEIFHAMASFEDSLWGNLSKGRQGDDKLLFSGQSWMHNSNCRFEYGATLAKIARLRSLELWTRTMDNLWRLAHMEDGNSALPILYHIGIHQGKLFKEKLDNQWSSRNPKSTKSPEMNSWMDGMEELRLSMKSLLEFASNGEDQRERLTRPIEPEQDLFREWLEEGNKSNGMMARATLESFRNRATLSIWLINHPLNRLSPARPPVGAGKLRSPQWMRARYLCEHCDVTCNSPESLWEHMESQEHQRNLLCFPGHTMIPQIRNGNFYTSCPQCMAMFHRSDWEEHKGSRRHHWRDKEIQQGLSWGSLAKECFLQDWKEFTKPDTWWLYEFAAATPGAQQDRDRILGTHSWSMGLPLSAAQIQLLHPKWVVGPSQVAAFWPDWMAGGEVIAGAVEMPDAFAIMKRWKYSLQQRLSPNFLLIPGHKLFELESLL